MGEKGLHVAWCLVFVSVTVQFVGIFGYHVDSMSTHGAADMFSLDDTQIGSRIGVLFSKRPAALVLPALAIIGALIRLRYRDRGVGMPNDRLLEERAND